MKLVTQLKIFGVFATVLIIVLGIEIYWNSQRVSLALEKETVARELVQKTFTLNILTGDYTQTHGDRAEVQWRAQLLHINKSIANYKDESPEEQAIINQLTQEQQTTLTHFSQLKEGIKEQKANKSKGVSRQALSQELEESLTSQLSIDTQRIVSLASRLSEIDSERVAAIRHMSIIFLIVAAGFLVISLILIYFLLAINISREMKKLTEGTKILGSGNLSFRFDGKTHDEFGQLKRNFNVMATQLQELDQAKDEFLALASHELRTPMTAIKGLVSMIIHGDYGPLPKEIKKPLTNISISTERQVHLINDLLDVSRLRTGKVVFKMTDFLLKEAAKGIVESLQPIAEQKGIKLTDAPAHKIVVHADDSWVKQILNNLIGNALKFTDKGSVAISYLLEKNRALIIVTDTGVGIDSSDQKKLFKKFQQLNSDMSGKPVGSGLGLYISREIARNMGGDVWIERSTPGKGSTFILALPLAPSA